MCLWVSYKKKYGKNYFFASLKSLKKGVGSGSGFISQRYGSPTLENILVIVIGSDLHDPELETYLDVEPDPAFAIILE